MSAKDVNDTEVLIYPQSEDKMKEAGVQTPEQIRTNKPDDLIPESSTKMEEAQQLNENQSANDTVQLVPVQPENVYIVSRCLKYSLILFSMCFWFVGSLFAAVGGWHTSQKTGYETLSDFATDPPLILAALGCFIFIVSSFGVLGALRENICLLRVYKIFLVAILIFEFCTGLVGFAFWPEVKKLIQVNLNTGIVKYVDDRMLRDLIDLLQRDLKCCGSQTMDDWDSNRYFSCKNIASYRHCGVPWSCCVNKAADHYRTNTNRQCGYGVRKERALVRMGDVIHTMGCLDKGFEFFKTNMLMIAGLAVAFTLPLFAGILMSMRLAKQIRKQLKYVDPALYEKMRKEQTVKCCMTSIPEMEEYV